MNEAGWQQEQEQGQKVQEQWQLVCADATAQPQYSTQLALQG
jgi:hypothetical protein